MRVWFRVEIPIFYNLPIEEVDSQVTATGRQRHRSVDIIDNQKSIVGRELNAM